MKKVLGLFALLIIIVIGMVFAKNYLQDNSPFGKIGKTPKVTINNHTFNLYVAKTSKDKEIGLSKYNNLGEDYGMLFPFDSANYYAFWMKSMKFPIDIIFIQKDNIVTIFSNAKPPKSLNEILTIFKPTKPADTVLEINSGLSQKYNFKQNDKVLTENL